MGCFISLLPLIGLRQRPRSIAQPSPQTVPRCRPIYFTLGTQYLRDITEEDLYKFLKLLERKLPGYILGCHCKKLHAISNAHNHIKLKYCHEPSDRLSPCQKNDIKLVLIIIFTMSSVLLFFRWQ